METKAHTIITQGHLADPEAVDREETLRQAQVDQEQVAKETQVETVAEMEFI